MNPQNIYTNSNWTEMNLELVNCELNCTMKTKERTRGRTDLSAGEF